MEPQPGWLNDCVVRRPRSFRGSARDLVGASVLRSSMQGHEANRRAKDALFPDSGQGEEFSQIHLVRLALFDPC
jgi:hypothetical protein